MKKHTTGNRIILLTIGLCSCFITASCASRPPHMAKSKMIKIKNFQNPELAQATPKCPEQLVNPPCDSKG